MKKTITLSLTLKGNAVARRLLYSLLVIVLFGSFIIMKSGLGVDTSFAQETSVNSSPGVQPKSYDLPDVDNYVNIPYFINSDEMTSTLVLNNDLPVVAKAEVMLFNHHGEALKLPTFTLQPLNAERFNLAELTSNAPGDFSAGNIQIFYHAPMMSITSQITVTSTSKRISFDSSASSAMDYHSSQLSAILWLPDNETQAKAALTNTTLSAINIIAQAGLQKRTIILGPRETQVLELRDFIASEQHKSQAILLTLGSSGTPGALIATGFAYNETRGFSTNLPFIDRSTIKTKVLAGAHFKFGSVAFNEGFPQGVTFRAPLVLANPTDLPVLANIAIDYTLNGMPDRVDLGRIKLGAKQIKEIDLSQELANRGLTGPVDDAGIQITYNGQPGALLARLTSQDETGDFVFDTPIKDPLAESFRISGNYPWRLDGGYNTVVHLKNTTNREVYAIAQIRYEGGSYNPDKIKLAPYQTVALDIRKLRDAQDEDVRGEVMPMNVTSGQILWYEQTLESLIGRAETFVVADGISSSFSCGGPGNCGMSFSSASASPSTKNATAEDSGVFFTVQETDRDCLNSSFGPFAITSGLSWSSTDPSVATVDVSGGFVRCISAGTATIKATWSTGVNNCGMSCQFIPVNPVAAGTLQIKPHFEAMNPPRAVQGFGDFDVNITGKGFGNNKNAVIITVAGTGITPVVNRATPNEILATFTIAADATAGNHTVTLKVNNRNADRTLNFFVQIPTKLRRDSISDVINQQGGCGAHRDVQYTLMDQQTPTAQPIDIDAPITETFSNFTADNPGIRPPRVTDRDLVAGVFPDFVGYEIPTCPPAFTANMDQTFVVRISTMPYPLTTKNRIIWSVNAAGTKSISVTITTP